MAWRKQKLSINFTKTKYVLFRTLRSKPPPSNLSLSVHGKKIERVSEITFLGITYNENLSWKKHMLKTLGKIRSSSGASPVGGQGGNAPQIFVFAPPPDFFLPPHGMFLGGRSCFFGAEKTLKFVISARKSLRILAKTFFFRSPAFGRKICDFGQKKPSEIGENLCPLDFNFAPPISRSWRRR